MKWQTRMGLLALTALLGRGGARRAQTNQSAANVPEIEKQVRKELGALPYYGVFDLLTFQVSDKGVVTLGGYVVNGSLKSDAEHDMKKVKGVTEVANQIEIAPASISDDDARWGIYRAIYRDSFLSRYWTPADALAESRPRMFGGAAASGGWGPSASRAGRAGRSSAWSPWAIPRSTSRQERQVTLAGVVDNAQDRDVASLRQTACSALSGHQRPQVTGTAAARKVGEATARRGRGAPAPRPCIGRQGRPCFVLGYPLASHCAGPIRRPSA